MPNNFLILCFFNAQILNASGVYASINNKTSQHVFDMLYNPVKGVLAFLNVVAYVKSLSQFPYCGVKILKILHPNISICKFYTMYNSSSLRDPKHLQDTRWLHLIKKFTRGLLNVILL